MGLRSNELTWIGGPDIPSGRSDICTVLIAAPDESSYNIFVIAGIRK